MPNRIQAQQDTPTTTATPSLVSVDSFKAATAEGIRMVRNHADKLTRKEDRLLSDVSRGRYVTGLVQVLEICKQRCQDVTAATALPEAFRGFILAGHPGFHTCVYDAFRGETDANGICDLAQLEYAIAPSKATRQRAIEALNRQLVETRKALDALHRDEANGRLSLYRS